MSHRPLFPLGQIVATPGALEALARSGDSAHGFFMRHATGDWGSVCAQDRQANERALHTGERILSAYQTRLGEKLWVITEADRSSTCLLQPSEYLAGAGPIPTSGVVKAPLGTPPPIPPFYLVGLLAAERYTNTMLRPLGDVLDESGEQVGGSYWPKGGVDTGATDRWRARSID